MNRPVENTIVGSCVFQFKVDYELVKHLPTGMAFYSDAVSAGGHLWRIKFFPSGEYEADEEYVSIFLEHMSKSRSVGVIFEVFMMGRDSKPSMSLSHIRRLCQTFEIMEDKDSGDCWGWGKFLERTTLEKDYLTGRHVTFACAIMIIDDSCVPVPPSDIGTHLGRLLDHADGTDVSFKSSLTMRHSMLIEQCLLALRPAHRSSDQSSSAPCPRLQCHPSRCTTSHLQHSKLCSGSYTQMNCP
ncbi:hypothetical protein ACQJBY_001031 [Aegilops geniculata]